ncbi:MAG: serine hydrolase [Candidatus Paceibacterota bacterium]|jgi:D-alanyl-D-alanine carboxypeptidase
MDKENFFFLSFLVLLSVFCFIFSNSSNVSGGSFSFLKASSIDLLRPLSKEKIADLYLNSNNFFSVFVNLDEGREIVLSEKKSNEVIPIASLTKLMTAVVALENYGLKDDVNISAAAINTYSTAGELREKEVISVEDLLYVTLIESSNDGAEALAEKMGRDEFILKMNKKAAELGMKNTRFVNPTGLDIFIDASEKELKENNVSSASDLEKLVVYILKNQPLIPQILSNSEKQIKSSNGVVHNLKNTNILLKENSSYLWGKTGYTKEANGCIILILKSYDDDLNGYIVNVITGADDRFSEARKLNSWLQDSFIW